MGFMDWSPRDHNRLCTLWVGRVACLPLAWASLTTDVTVLTVNILLQAGHAVQ